jgi:hypothetical protein
MAVKKGDIIDERKRFPDSCGLMVKIMGGGEGFEKIVCCDHELTEQDVVPQVGSPLGRKRGELPLAVIIDEKKLFPNSCGLRVMIMDGGAGFREIRCCGHSLTMNSIHELKYGQLRRDAPGGPPAQKEEDSGLHGNA